MARNGSVVEGGVRLVVKFSNEQCSAWGKNRMAMSIHDEMIVY